MLDKATDKVLNKILKEWSWRVKDGNPNINNPAHYVHLVESIKDLKFKNNFHF